MPISSSLSKVLRKKNAQKKMLRTHLNRCHISHHSLSLCQGLSGETGADGLPGEDGERGEPGPAGPDGAAGQPVS